MKQNITFQYPKNYDQKDGNIFYFIERTEDVLQPAIQHFKKASLHTGTENFLQKWRAKDILKKWLAFAGIRYRTVKKDENIIWFSEPHKYNFFHWFNDTLPGLMLLEEKGVKGKIILNSNLQSYKFIHDTLQLLEWEYEFYPAATIIACKDLYISGRTAPPGSQHPVYFKKLVNRFIIAANCGIEVPFRKIFISRKGTLERKAEPANEIEKILKENEFDSVLPGDLDFKDQVRFFWQTNVLVSAHGGGLTNMAFMQKGSKIIEIRRDDDNLNFCFLKMANICKHDYYYLLGKGKYKCPDALNDDYIIEPGDLKKLLQSGEENLK